ncbi:hypothetical protein EPJ70_04965 [Brachyspira aalborgi]|uniref:Uncharacterized protein n=1 Tax=Brachyspira aalborgi TaxID=29522 RepID=A0A5C8F865_9SPIR|nr:hypothetical protein [Brachyspira aalborgi]TXJ45739.1 hypothetical protein EPJ70_04965 [Brachyspira aalborgi]
MLIVSSDGKTNLNSLPLSFVGASATVSDVKVDKFGGQGDDILLFPTNFIIENGNLYLTNLTTTNKDGGEVKAAVSNKVTLTFSLSGENLSRYTDTAEIFVGKMQTNISVETFKKSKFDLKDKNGGTKVDQPSINGGDITSEPHENIFFQNSQFAVGTDDTTKFFLTNSQDGKAGNKLSVAEFTTILSNSIKKNADIQSYNSLDFEITSATNKDAPRIATWTIKFKPSVFYNEHSILLNMSKNDSLQDVGGWVD